MIKIIRINCNLELKSFPNSMEKLVSYFGHFLSHLKKLYSKLTFYLRKLNCWGFFFTNFPQNDTTKPHGIPKQQLFSLNPSITFLKNLDINVSYLFSSIVLLTNLNNMNASSINHNNFMAYRVWASCFPI